MRSTTPLVVALAALASACGSSEPIKTPSLMGEACTVPADCASKSCVHGLCTRACVVQGDCPEGFDCGLMVPEDVAPLCYKALWTAPATGGYGTPCAASAKGCGGADPCATGFTCHAALKCDARAYCSKGCTADADCPPSMFCGQDDKDAPRTCLKRGACQPCGADDQCPSGHVCATLEGGERYCAKTCVAAGDCLKPNRDSDSGNFIGAPFEVCSEDPGGKGKVCAPAGGACHGESKLTGAAKAAGICSPCRVGHPEDCAAPGTCFEDTSGERFCTGGCKATLAQGSSGYNITKDTCPAGSFCFFGGGAALQGCGAGCTVQGLCTADPGYANATCHPAQ